MEELGGGPLEPWREEGLRTIAGKSIEEWSALSLSGYNVEELLADGRSVLYQACLQKERAVIVWLLSHNPKMVNMIDAFGDSALHAGALSGDVEVVEILLKEGACTTTQSNTGATPLFLASQCGHACVVERLLSSSLMLPGLVNIPIVTGETPLYSACLNEHVAVVELLISYSACLKSVVCESGNTPLHAAAYRGNDDICNMLLSNGANVNAVSVNGYTPLHLAAFADSSICVALLLSHGASVSVRHRDLNVSSDFLFTFIGEQKRTQSFEFGNKS